MTTQPANVLVTSTGELEKLSSAELVALYNSLNPPKPVERFASKTVGVQRTLGLLAVQQGRIRPQDVPGSLPPPGPKPDLSAPPAQEEQPSAPRARATRTRLFRRAPADRVRPHRAGTDRAKVLELLKRGTTLAEVMEATGCDEGASREHIWLIARHLGYGLDQASPDAKIYAFVKPGVSPF